MASFRCYSCFFSDDSPFSWDRLAVLILGRRPATSGFRWNSSLFALRSGCLFPKPCCISHWGVFMFFQLPLSGVAVCHAAFVQLCYGVIAKLLFHSVHHSGLPLPFVLLINKNIIYYNSGNGSLLGLCLGQLWKCNVATSLCFVRNL